MTTIKAYLNAIKFTSLVKNNLSIIVRIRLIQHIKTRKNVAHQIGKPVSGTAFKNYYQEIVCII